MKIKQEFGGAIRYLLVLLMVKRSIAEIRAISNKSNNIKIYHIVMLALLSAFMAGTSLAQISMDLGSSRLADAPIESSAIRWASALPDDMSAENSNELLRIGYGFEGAKNAVHIQRDLAAYKASALTGTDAPEPPKGDIMICLLSGRGFALKSNETHVLRMNVELIKDVDPLFLRDLMTSNKSIDDIKEGLKTKEGITSLRGSLRINESSYSLLNTKLMQSEDNATIIDADVAMLYLKPAPGMIMKAGASDKAEIAGHIAVTVAPSEGGLIGKGELVMNGAEYSGKYIVLLHIEKAMPCNVLPPGGSMAPPIK